MIAKRLAAEQQRFEEAMDWFHRIFDPTGTLDGPAPQKYWVTKPFFLTTDAHYLAQRIDDLLTNLADPARPERRGARVRHRGQWRDKPFRPHVVARFRTVAYQRTVVMSYLDNLVDWGDYLFRQDTMESITQATQLYVLADKLLGPRPRVGASPVEVSAADLPPARRRDLDAFGNALVELENILPDSRVAARGRGRAAGRRRRRSSSLYFCVPPNDKLLGYWDTVADRLFKIRNSQNIDGVERQLALFAPPIDPGDAGARGRGRAGHVVRPRRSERAAAGLPVPRDGPKATELAEEVRQLGNALLGRAREQGRRGAGLLRNDLEVKLLKAQRDLKVMEIDCRQGADRGAQAHPRGH